MFQQFYKASGFSPSYSFKHPGVYHPENVEHHPRQGRDCHWFSPLAKGGMAKVVSEEAQVEKQPGCYLEGQNQLLKMLFKTVFTSH